MRDVLSFCSKVKLVCIDKQTHEKQSAASGQRGGNTPTGDKKYIGGSVPSGSTCTPTNAFGLKPDRIQPPLKAIDQPTKYLA